MEKENRSSILIPIALLLLAGLTIYSNTLHAPFYFDDYYNIFHNLRILNVWDWAGMSNDLPTRALSYFSFAINYKIGGFSTFGYHVVNVVLHLFNGVLVFALTRLLLTTPALKKTTPFSVSGDLIALSAALIFICHPIQTQAVTYIVQRMTSMASFFYLATILSYLHFRISGERTFYLLGLCTALLSILSKEISLTLPAVLLICELIFFDQTGATVRPLAKRLFPFFLIALIIPGLFFLNHQSFAQQGGQMALVPAATKNISRSIYFITQWNVIRTYLGLLVFPVRQTFDYDFPLSPGLFDPATFASLILLTGILALAFRLIRKQPLASFGIFFFFLALSVESSIIPIPDLIFEHRLYLPLVGFSMFTASCLARLLRSSKIFAMVMALLCLVLGTLTYQRNAVWANELVFWKDQTRKAPLKGRGHFCLGETYYKNGQYLSAADSFLNALQWTPRDKRNDAYFNNLGSAYSNLGETSRAEYWYRNGLDEYPSSGSLLTNLAILKRNEGDLENAVSLLEKAIASAPGISIAYYELAQIHVMRKEYSHAIFLLKKALALDRFLPPAHELLARVYALQRNQSDGRKIPDTVDALQDAMKTDPLNPSLNIRLGEVYRLLGQESAAIASFRKAITLAPSYEEGYTALALFYKEKGSKEKAAAVIVEYLQYKKDHASLPGY